jgi:hypothetical protein
MALRMLSRRWLINYLLIALIGIFIYAGNRYQASSGFSPVNSISSLKPQDIHTVIIETPNDSQVVLRNAGNQWLFEKPVQWPADNTTMERLISIVQSKSDLRLPAGEIELATLGLDSPQVTLILNDTRIEFGTTNNIGQRRYVKVAATVYLLPDLHLPFITQGLIGLIDRRLLPRSISLKSLKIADLILSKSSIDTWQSEAFGEAEKERINTLGNSWQTLYAGRIKTYDDSKLPEQIIIARLEDGSEIDFFLMATKPEIVIAHPGLDVQYHFSEKHYNDLLSIAQ